MGRVKMTPYHHPTCVTSVWVRSLPKVSITVVLTTKRVTKKAKEWRRKMAILWQFLSHMGSLMAPRLLQLEYPLAPMIWSAFEHFRMSGSTHTGQLLCSFTEAIRVASPFGTNCSCCLCWLNLELVLVALCYFVVGKIGTDTGGALWWLTFECMLLVPNKSSSVFSECTLQLLKLVELLWKRQYWWGYFIANNSVLWSEMNIR